MKKNNIYDLMNNINLDSEIEEMEDISEFEKKKIMNNFRSAKNMKKNKNKNLKKGILVAGLALVVATSQTNLGKEAYASAKSKIDNMSYFVTSFMNINEEAVKYSNIIDKTIEQNGIALKLSNVIIDNDEMIITSLLEVDDVDIKSLDFDYKVFINGKRADRTSSIGTFSKLDGDNNIYKDVKILNISNLDLENKVDIDISTNKIYKTKEKDNKSVTEKVSGKWNYVFSADVSELQKDTKTIDLNHTFELDNRQYSLDKFTINPVSQTIFGTILDGQSTDYEMELRGKDNLNNDITFYLRYSDKNSLVFKYESMYDTFDLNLDNINLDLYVRKLPKQSGRLTGEWTKVLSDIKINIE